MLCVIYLFVAAVFSPNCLLSMAVIVWSQTLHILRDVLRSCLSSVRPKGVRAITASAVADGARCEDDYDDDAIIIRKFTAQIANKHSALHKIPQQCQHDGWWENFGHKELTMCGADFYISAQSAPNALDSHSKVVDDADWMVIIFPNIYDLNFWLYIRRRKHRTNAHNKQPNIRRFWIEQTVSPSAQSYS